MQISQLMGYNPQSLACLISEEFESWMQLLLWQIICLNSQIFSCLSIWATLLVKGQPLVQKIHLMVSSSILLFMNLLVSAKVCAHSQCVHLKFLSFCVKYYKFYAFSMQELQIQILHLVHWTGLFMTNWQTLQMCSGRMETLFLTKRESSKPTIC